MKNTKKTNKEEIISLAKMTKHYCDLLIKQSDNWKEDDEMMRRLDDEMIKTLNLKP
jgi:hypothetical protein